MFIGLDCGCTANEKPRGGLRIDFCPLHKAAPELLAAVKALIEFGDWMQEPKQCRAGSALYRAVDTARAALAKAEGRGE